MKLLTLAISLSVVLVSGCVSTPKPIYDYGAYSESFYAMKKDSGAENSEQWRVELENIITNSHAQSLRVPPGVYANLGYIFLKANNTEKAISYFEEEKNIYPESEIFMKNLIKKANLKGNE